jgi:deoxycytidylate deaminase
MYYDAKFKRKMKKLTIYIARYKTSTKGVSGHSAPCSNCIKKIKHIGIKKIVYIDAEGNIQKCLSKNYFTDHICPGYKEFYKQNISVH